MSEVVCRCPACTAKFKVDAKYAGKKARCPKCAVVVEVPAAGAPSLTGTSIPAGQPASSTTTIQPSITTQAPPKAVAPKAVAVPGGLSSSSIPVPQPSQIPPKAAPVARALPARPVAPPTEEALNAVVEEAVPVAEPAPSASSDGFGFQINTKAKGSKSSALSASTVAGPAFHSEPVAAPHTHPAPHGKKDSGNAMLLVFAGIGGVLLVGALGIAGFMLMANNGTTVVKKDGGKGTKTTKVAASNSGKLVIDFAEDDRKSGFSITIDGRPQPALTRGELAFDLKPGDHSVSLRRRGESFEKTVSITAGSTEKVKPEWKKSDVATASSVTNQPTLPNTGGTNFQIGTATGATVKGFDGFIQNFGLAKEQAAKSQKNVLMVIAQSDAEPRSMELGRATQQQSNKDLILASYVPVIIDFPRGAEGRSNLWDQAQNSGILDEYNLNRGTQLSVPVILIVDPKGKPFYIEREFKQGLSSLSTYLTAAAAAKTERDNLWSAVKGDAIDPAAKLVAWLLDKKIIGSYLDETTQWLAIGRRMDANNDAGHLECLLEGNMLARAANLNPDDQIEAKQFAEPLNDWLTTKRFKDEDRGAKLHLMAGTLLLRLKMKDEGVKHLTRASTYSPKDSELKETLANIKTYIERGNILSNGTGFVVSDAGYIMTNHHVIDGPGKVMVRLADNKTLVEGKVIASDSKRDMAIVKIEVPAGVTLKTVPVTPAAIGRGVEVAAFGYPLAGSVSASMKFTQGRVSALPDDTNEQMVMLDLRVNPGNSGGPLCDQKGNVVGMVSAKTRSNMFTNEDSLGLAIPSADLVAYLDKHLPPGTPRPAVNNPAARPEWSDTDAQVSPGVLLILKME